VETIAVYWEPKPKIYGFKEVFHLSLLSVAVRPQKMMQWGRSFLETVDSGIDFHLALAKYSNSEELRLYLLLEKQWVDSLMSHLDKRMAFEDEKDLTLTSPVELISFQGPHFGDRYGIAESAFKALDDKKVPVLLAACSGAAVYIVVPEKKLDEARTSLTEAFTVP
jgi:aspartokinase